MHSQVCQAGKLITGEAEIAGVIDLQVIERFPVHVGNPHIYDFVCTGETHYTTSFAILTQL